MTPRVQLDMKGANIAERKRLKKAFKKEKRERLGNLSQQYQAIVDQALRGYEVFHKLPQGTATVEQV